MAVRKKSKRPYGSKGSPVKATLIQRDAKTGMMVVVSTDKAGKILTKTPRTVKFGSVFIKVGKLDAAHVSKSTKASTLVFDKAIGHIAKPGVKIDFEKGVPRYRADPENPELVLRTLNGKTQRGQMRAGKFIAAE